MAWFHNEECIDGRPEFDDAGRLVERPDPMTEGLSRDQWAALAILAKSRTPWVRRSAVDHIGPGVLESLIDRGLADVWSSMAVQEREYREVIPKKRPSEGKVRPITFERPTRARRVTFAALTALGTALTNRDVFQGGPTQFYLDRRRRDEHGQWVLPGVPAKGRMLGGSVKRLCPDLVPDQPEKPTKGRRAG